MDSRYTEMWAVDIDSGVQRRVYVRKRDVVRRAAKLVAEMYGDLLAEQSDGDED